MSTKIIPFIKKRQKNQTFNFEHAIFAVQPFICQLNVELSCVNIQYMQVNIHS